MGSEAGLLLAGTVAILGLILLLVLVRSIQRRSREVEAPPSFGMVGTIAVQIAGSRCRPAG